MCKSDPFSELLCDTATALTDSKQTAASVKRSEQKILRMTSDGDKYSENAFVARLAKANNELKERAPSCVNMSTSANF